MPMRCARIDAARLVGALHGARSQCTLKYTAAARAIAGRITVKPAINAATAMNGARLDDVRALVCRARRKPRRDA